MIDEPLIESAPLARAIAKRHCSPSCRGYHGFWQQLRLMKLGKTLSGLSEEFTSELRREAARWREAGRAEGGRAHVLISGCADYSALAHVLAACDAEQCIPTVTALDLCDSPLVLSRWFAQRQGREISTIRADILEHDASDRYDLIVTSGFLGYFPGAVRPRLFASYARMLRAGGLLLVSNRLRSGDEEKRIGFSGEAARDFAELVADRNASLPDPAQLSRADAIDAARGYCEVMKSYPVNGRERLEALVTAAGLDWTGGGEHIARIAPRARVNAPTLADGSPYLLIVARKR